MTTTSKGGHGVVGLAGAVLISSMVFFGCSQEKAPQQAATQQAAPADQPSGQQPVVVDTAKAKEHFMKGIQLARAGKIDEAIKEYEASILINPNSPEALSNLGYAYYDKGLVDNAISTQMDALKIDPELTNAYFGLGLAFERKNEKKKAIEAWKQYIARAEPHSKYWMAAQEHLAKLEGKKMKKTKLKVQAAPPSPAPVEKTPAPAKDAR